MSDIKNKKEKLRELFEVEKIKELAFWLVELHMGTQRNEAVLGAFKRHLRKIQLLLGSILVEEIDRAMIEFKAEPT